MNSNVLKFFRGIGEGYRQSSDMELRCRTVPFVGRDKRNHSAEKLRQQHAERDYQAAMVIVVVAVWVTIFVSMAVAVMLGL